MTTIETLIAQVFVKENLQRARGDLSLRAAAEAIGVHFMQIRRWEDPNGGVPRGEALTRAVRWVKRRIRQEE